jgi:hypothetical protein
LQPSVASTVIFYEFPHEPLALLSERFYRKKVSAICVKKKVLNNTSHIHPLLPQAFSVEIPSWMGF